MSRPYLTVKEYAAKYGVPKSTIRVWIRDGKLKVFKGKTILIPDDQPIPYKDPKIPGWRYQFH